MLKCDLSYVASVLSANVNFTYVRTEKLRWNYTGISHNPTHDS